MKRALVTGGASGIGAALVATLRADGFAVTAVDVTPGPGITVADAADIPFDLYDFAFLNAGVIGPPGPCWSAAAAEVWHTNYFAVRRALAILIPGWIEQEHNGHIVITASMAALLPMPYTADYCGSKAALLSLAETLVHELAAAGTAIGVSIALPSFTVSRLAAPLTGPFAEHFRGFIERGTPAEEVARAIYEQAAAGRFLIATHPSSLEGVLPRWEAILRGERPPRPTGRRMDALFAAPY